MLLIAVIGTPAAYLLATRNFRGRAAVLTPIELPLIVPPEVAGLAVLAAFGPNGILGRPSQTQALSWSSRQPASWSP